VLEVKGLRAGYGRIPALHGIDLGVRRGELVALVGANGAGKTTLLRALSGVQPAVGSVIFDRTAIESFSAEKRVACGIVQCPEGRQVFGPLSVDDNLRLGAYRRGRADTARSLERVYGLFPALAGHRSQAAGTLSGGQQQMLAIGRALMAQPRLLLLDEPSMGLAPRLVAEIFACAPTTPRSSWSSRTRAPRSPSPTGATCSRPAAWCSRVPGTSCSPTPACAPRTSVFNLDQVAPSPGVLR